MMARTRNRLVGAGPAQDLWADDDAENDLQHDLR